MSGSPAEHRRTFFAVDVRCTAGLRKALAALDGMGRALRAVDPAQLHITLKFLGETPAELVPELTGRLAAACAEVAAFDVELTGLGVFPHARRPAVVWAGIERSKPIERLAAVLEDAAAELGFERESRPYHPHVTLARVKARPPAALDVMLRDESESTYGSCRIDAVTLYRSDTTTHGPVYTSLGREMLAKTGVGRAD